MSSLAMLVSTVSLSDWLVNMLANWANIWVMLESTLHQDCNLRHLWKVRTLEKLPNSLENWENSEGWTDCIEEKLECIEENLVNTKAN